jgi:hypothetical protein
MRRLLRAAGVVFLAGIAVGLGLVVAVHAYLQSADVILSGVREGDLSLTGLTSVQAAAQIDRRWNQERTILVVDPQTQPPRTWTATPAEFGLAVDAQGAAARALAVGRGRGLVADIFDFADAYRHGRDIAPVVTFDRAAARLSLEKWAAKVSEPPSEATVDIREGEVVLEQGKTGRDLDVEATLAFLAADPAAAMQTYDLVPLIFRAHPPVLADASSAANRAQSLLASHVALRAYDPVTGETLAWHADRAEIASWLSIDRLGGSLRVQVHPERVRGYASTLIGSLGPERTLDLDQAAAGLLAALDGTASEPLVIRYKATDYTLKPGETLQTVGWRMGMPLWKMLEFNPSWKGRIAPSGTGIVLPPKDAMLALPVVTNKRIVISISQQRLWAYQDGALLSEHIVSTGIASSPTMAGVFQVQTHIPNAYASNWDLWMPDFLGIYDALPGFTNGIHGLPLLSNGVRLWANVLGRPASFGCIILDLKAAADIYSWADDGTVVEIR